MMEHSKSTQQVRVRIAPSPSGLFHMGTARTALFNYIYANQYHGSFIVRIEDTDLERSDPAYEKDILQQLRWLGLEWDEGPAGENKKGEKGDYGPYRQSERFHRYATYCKAMIESGSVFWCPHTKEELAKEKEAQIKRKESPRHICSAREAAAKEKGSGILRFRSPDSTIAFQDCIRGEITFDLALLGDFAIAKDLSTPLYNFAVVADDHDMKISHIIRGEDHISNTPKQLLIWKTLFHNEPPPQYAHLPLILGPDRSKLSKRHGTFLVRDFKQEGYLAEALINFIALLGWNPGTEQELFSLDEIIASFSLDRVQKSGAIFNQDRLDWMNSQYILKKEAKELAKLVKPYLKIKSGDAGARLEAICELEKPRMKKLSDIQDNAHYFFRDPEYDPNLLVWRKADRASAKENLAHAQTLLSGIPDKSFSKDIVRAILLKEAEKGGDRGKLLWPLRAALTGKESSPDPIDIIAILGKKKSLERIRKAYTKL